MTAYALTKVTPSVTEDRKNVEAFMVRNSKKGQVRCQIVNQVAKECDDAIKKKGETDNANAFTRFYLFPDKNVHCCQEFVTRMSQTRPKNAAGPTTTLLHCYDTLASCNILVLIVHSQECANIHGCLLNQI